MNKQLSNSYVLDNVGKVYGHDNLAITALAGIDLVIPRGVFWAIMGPSGSGKSTLLQLIGLLDRPTEGSIIIGDATITADSDLATLARLRREKIGFIFQQFFLLPRLSARDNIVLPALYAQRKLGLAREHAQALLAEVGLNDREAHRPNELSGGEQQRVAIARALMNDPDIILADEPTGNLDSQTGNAILELVERLNQKGKTIILITHDDRIGKRAQKILRLEDGRII